LKKKQKNQIKKTGKKKNKKQKKKNNYIKNNLNTIIIIKINLPIFVFYIDWDTLL
jgi:hypothetical protein